MEADFMEEQFYIQSHQYIYQNIPFLSFFYSLPSQMNHNKHYILNHNTIYQELQRQTIHVRKLSSAKSSLRPSSTSKLSTSLTTKRKYSVPHKFMAIPIPLGYRVSQHLEKENRKMFERIMSAKSTISAAKFEKENKKRFFYRKNLIKTKYKRPDFSNLVRNSFNQKEKKKVNYEKLYNFSSKQSSLERKNNFLSNVNI